MQRRLMSVAAVTTIAAVSLTGCNAKDVANKAKSAASAAATNSMVANATSKGAAAIKSKLGGASASASGSAGSAAGGATVDLGKFAKNPAAKAVGTYFSARQAGDAVALKPVTTPRTLKAAQKYIAKNQGKPFMVTVTGVKGKNVSACVGPKGKVSQTVVVKGGKVAAIKKGTATCK